MEAIYKIFITILCGSIFFYYVQLPFLLLLFIFITGIFLFFIDKFTSNKNGEIIILILSFLTVGMIYAIRITDEKIDKDKIYKVNAIKNGSKFEILKINNKITQKRIFFKSRVRGIKNGKYKLNIKIDYLNKYENNITVRGEILEIKPSKINKLKNTTREKIKKISVPYSYEFFSFLRAILLGEQDGLSQELLEGFRYTGAAHILVISGLHIGLIIGIVVFILGKLPLGYNMRYFLALISITLYVVMLNFSPSVFRAYIMGGVFLISKLLKEEPNIKKSVSLAGIITLLINPTLILSVSFQLSYMALFGIIYIYKLVEIKSDNKLLEMLILSISIQIALAPIFVYYFNSLPIFVMIINIIAIPLGVLVVGGAFISLIIGFFSIKISIFLGFFLEKLYNILKFYIIQAKNIPLIQIKIYKYIPIYMLLVFYCIIGYYIYQKVIKKQDINLKKGSFIILIYILVISIFNFKSSPSQYKLNKNLYIKSNLKKGILIWNRNLTDRDILKFKKKGINTLDIVFVNYKIPDKYFSKIEKIFGVKNIQKVNQNETIKLENIRIEYSKKGSDILVK
ncbi:MAG: ComEC/Rec2 family competence protein [Fusobacteriota bacterium]